MAGQERSASRLLMAASNCEESEHLGTSQTPPARCLPMEEPPYNALASPSCAASGVDLRTLMNRMGHKTRSLLAPEVYAKADPGADRAAAETIVTHVLGAMSHDCWRLADRPVRTVGLSAVFHTGGYSSVG
jgi:hypothetical protein